MKRRWPSVFSMGCLMASLIGLSPQLSHADSISLIGLDEAGKEISYDIKEKDSQGNLGSAYELISEQTLSAATKSESKSGKFQLKKIWAGAGLVGVLGLGPIIKAKVAPGFFLIFSKTGGAK